MFDLSSVEGDTDWNKDYFSYCMLQCKYLDT